MLKEKGARGGLGDGGWGFTARPKFVSHVAIRRPVALPLVPSRLLRGGAMLIPIVLDPDGAANRALP